MNGLTLNPLFHTAENSRFITTFVLARYPVNTNHRDILRREAETEHPVKRVVIQEWILFEMWINDCKLPVEDE
jgi:hypothetical protein